MPEMNQEFLKKLLSGKYDPEADMIEEEEKNRKAEQKILSGPGAQLPVMKQDTELVTLPIALLTDFPDNPIPPYAEEEMEELTASIRENGIITPLLVRPFEKGYQIVDGRNRRIGARKAGYNAVPCIVRDLSDEDTAIYLVETIFRQRNVSKISIMQRARAYRLWLEALKRQGRRTDLTSSPLETKLRSDEIIANESRDSRAQINRFIRLTYLISGLQDRVDRDKPDFSFTAAVLISFLSEANQNAVYRFFLVDHSYGISMKVAELLREQDSAGMVLDEVVLTRVWESLNVQQPETDEDEPDDVVLPYKKIKHFFPPRCPTTEIEDIVVKALKQYFKSKNRKEVSRNEGLRY